MVEETSREYCRKCGIQVYPFSKKYSVSGEEYLCVRCAETTDREYLVRNSCSVCKRLLKKDEVKLVLPSKIYGDTQLPMMDRLICTQCYGTIGKKAPTRRSFRQRVEQARANIRRGIVKRAMRQYA